MAIMKPSFLVFALLISVSAALLESSTNQVGVSVVLTKHEFLRDHGHTCFYYKVESAASSVIEFELKSDGCENAEITSEHFSHEQYPAHHRWVSRASGFANVHGQHKNDVQNYVLCLKGNYDRTQGDVVVLSGPYQATGTGVSVPKCSAEGNWPTFAPEVSGTVQCIDAAAIAAAKAEAADVTVTEAEGSCPENSKITRTKSVTIAGYTATQSFVTEVVDDIQPEFVVTPLVSSTTVSCADLPLIPLGKDNITATDDCSGDPSVEYCDEQVAGTCPQNSFSVRTWTATDSCGNSRCHTQTVAVVDNDAPDFDSIPASTTLECTQENNNPTFFSIDEVTARDVCDPNSIVKTPVRKEIDGKCSNLYSIKTTWEAVDACGNSNFTTQWITLTDITPPTINPASLPNKDIDVNDPLTGCALPTPAVVKATDNCDTGEWTLGHEDDREDFPEIVATCKFQHTTVRSWTATDDCGNKASIERTFTVNDNVDPTLDVDESTITVDCDKIADHPWQAYNSNDNCPGALPVVNSSKPIPNSCETKVGVERQWIVTDDCGNDNTYTRTINVNDPYGPKIDVTGLPANNSVYNCTEGEVPTWESFDVSAQDTVCASTTYTVTGSDKTRTVPSGECADKYLVIFTWEAQDCAGNTDVVVRTIQVVDTINPTINFPVDPIPDNQCTPTQPQPTANDNCSPNFAGGNLTLVSNSSQRTQSPGCDANKTYTWNYEVYDECGNLHTDSIQSRSIDTEMPSIGTPGDKTRECNESLATDPPMSNDNCDGAITPTFSDSYVPEDGPQRACKDYTIYRLWTATDECGNANDVTETITVQDSSPAQLGSNPEDLNNVNCDSIPPPEEVCATDNCDGVNITLVEAKQSGLCDNTYPLHRTWTALDACGQGESYTQTIHVVDLAEPMFEDLTQAQNQTVECNETIPTRPTLTANDTCDTNVLVTEDPEKNQTTCKHIYTLTWVTTADDDCYDISHTQVITVEKNFAPVIAFSEPHSLECECGTEAELEACKKWPTLSDHCFDNNEITFCTGEDPATRDSCASYTETVIDDGDGCNSTWLLERTWTVTDPCAKSSSLTETLTIKDETKPTWQSKTPDDYSHSCEEPTDLPDIIAADTCDGEFTVSPELVRSEEREGECSHNVTEYWQYNATDCAGNSLVHPVTVTVYDVTPPTLNDPEDDGAQCGPTSPPDVCVDDNCKPVYLNYSETKDPSGICDRKFQLYREWLAYDDCGNQAPVFQTFTVNDDTAPVWDSPLGASGSTYDVPGFTEECAPVSWDPHTAQDNCIGNIDATFSTLDPIPDDNTACRDRKMRRNYTADDGCGNEIWAVVRTQIRDTTAPVLTSGIDKTPQQYCLTTPPLPEPVTATDCTFESPISVNPVLSNNDTTCQYIYTYTYTFDISDDCGNAATQESATVEATYDTTQTTVTVSEDKLNLESCVDTPSDPTATGEDGCFATVEPTKSGPMETPDAFCKYGKTKVWTFSVDDGCGGTASDTVTYRWNDTTSATPQPPTFDTTVDDFCTADGRLRSNITRFALDTCSGNLSAEPTFADVEGGCAYNFQEIFSYSWTDECGNIANDDTTVTYQNSRRPTITIGGQVFSNDALATNFDEVNSVTIKCFDNYTVPTFSANDYCGEALTATPTRTTEVDETCNTVYKYCVSASDSCTNKDKEVCWTVTIDYDVSPVLHGVPSDIVVECGFVPPVAEVTATHPCGDVNVSVVEYKKDGENCCDYQLKRVWTARTACAASAPETQTITVEDTFPPQFLNVCPDDEILCSEDIPPCEGVSAKHALKAGWCGEDLTSIDHCTVDTADSNRWSASYGSDTYNGNDTVIVRSAAGTMHVHGRFTGQPAVEVHVLFGNKLNRDASITYAGQISPSELKADCYGSVNDLQRVNASEWSFYSGISEGYALVDGTNCSVAINGNHASFGSGANGRNSLTGFSVDLDVTCDGTTTLLKLRIEVDSNPETNDAKCHDLVNAVCEDCCGYNDNCTAAVVNEYNTTTTVSCAGIYEEGKIYKIFTRTWVATDNNQNEVRASQNIYIKDEGKPKITVNGVPFDQFVPPARIECNDTYPVYTAGATDDCNTATPTHVPPSLVPSCAPHSGTLTYVFSALDECGNTDQKQFIIPVIDDVNPTGSVPEGNDDVTYNCSDEGSITHPDATFTDNCDSDWTVSEGSNVRSNNTVPGYPNCPDSYTITRTYTTTDACGNPGSVSYSYHVQDIVAPTIMGTNNDDEKECSLPAWQPNPGANDDCNSVTWRNFTEPVSTPAGCVNKIKSSIRRVWEATDLCGNSETQGYTSSVVDRTAPTITGPADSTVNCSAIPTPADITVSWSDNCDADTDITMDYAGPFTTPGDCGNEKTITYNWTRNDECGNVPTVFVWTIHVVDQINPTLGDVDAELPPQKCNETEVAPPVCAEDNCDGVEILFTEVKDVINCAHDYTLKRTYQAKDECGNLSPLKTQYVNITDKDAPFWTDSLPMSASEYCTMTSNQEDLNADDSCDDNVKNNPATKSNTSKVFQDGTGDCPHNYTFDRIWEIEDTCGNELNYSVTITRFDDQAPNTGKPADFMEQVSGPCLGRDTLAGLPEVPTLNPSDECDTDSSDIISVYPTNDNPDLENGTCYGNYTVYRDWSFTDRCGNKATESQTVSIYDTAKPTFTFVPAHTTVNCSEIPEIGSPTAMDTCVGAVTPVHVSDTPIDQDADCDHSYKIVRRWSATDKCGNTEFADQTITVVDEVDPELSDLPETTLFANCTAPGYDDVCASDNCGPVTLNFTETREDLTCSKYNYDLYRTWIVTDDCGNTDDFTQKVEVRDPDFPEWGPENYEMNKNADCSDDVVADVLTATDLCSTITVESSNISNFPVPGCDSHTVTISYWAEDECGKRIDRTQTVTVTDATSPNISFSFDLNDPANGQKNCSEDPAPLPVASATDDCSEINPIDDPTPNKIPGVCEGDYDIEWTWSTTDKCGNPVSETRVINYTDRTPPKFDYFPANQTTYDCNDIPARLTNHTFSDSCVGQEFINLTFLGTERVNSSECDSTYQLIHKYKLCDDCNNCIFRNQHVFVIDNEGPQVDDKPDETIERECSDDLAPPSVCAHDCAVYFNITLEETREDVGCKYEYDLIRVWTLVDDCGNDESFGQTVHVNDTAKPTITYTGDLNATATCKEFKDDNDIHMLQDVTPGDICSTTNTTIKLDNRTEGENEGCKYDRKYIRTWTATDECDNTESVEQTVTITDTTPPVVNKPSVECLSPVGTSIYAIENFTINGEHDITASDTCADLTELTFEVVNISSSQPDLDTPKPGFPNQLEDAYFDDNTNILYITPRVDQDDPKGRLFTIVVVVKDECDNEAYARKKYIVPINLQSFNEWTGIDQDVVDAEDLTCVTSTGTTFCPESCPCEYNDPLCTEGSVGTGSLSLSGNTYTFTANIDAASQGKPVTLVVGVDLTVVSHVTSSPAAKFGTPTDGFVPGLYWEIPSAGSSHTVTFQLRKRSVNFDVAWSKVAYQIINNRGNAQDALQSQNVSKREDTLANECSTGALAFNVAGVMDHAGQEVTGKVGVYGFLFGPTTPAPLYGISGAVVELWQNQAKVAVAFTDMSGDFAFSVTDCASNYSIRVADDGVFQSDLKLKEYVFPISFSPGNPLGNPQAVSQCSGNNAALFIHKAIVLDAKPTYDRGARIDRTTLQSPDGPSLDFTSYVGIGHSTRFWAEQYARMAATKEQLRVSVDILTAARNGAYAYLSGCGFASASDMIAALGGGDNKAKLVAASLSHFAEQGILADFRVVQEQVMLPYAKARVCDSPVANDAAGEFLDKILESY